MEVIKSFILYQESSYSFQDIIEVVHLGIQSFQVLGVSIIVRNITWTYYYEIVYQVTCGVTMDSHSISIGRFQLRERKLCLPKSIIECHNWRYDLVSKSSNEFPYQ